MAAKAGGLPPPLATEECVLVAKNKAGEIQEIRGEKAVLELASPILKRMLSEEWRTGDKLEIQNFGAKTMQLLVEFVNNFEVNQDASFKDLLELVIAADFFMVKSLVKCCVKELQSKISVANVWETLGQVLPIETLDSVAKACAKVIQGETDKCLEHPSFTKVGVESVIFLAKQESMHIKNEGELLLPCWKWAKLQSDPLQSFKKILPYLKIEEVKMHRMERLIDLGPTPDDFFALFPVPEDALGCRKYTKGTLRLEKRDYKLFCWEEELKTKLEIRSANVPVTFQFKIIPKKEFHLAEMWIPVFHNVESLWKHNEVSGAYELAPEPSAPCHVSVTISDIFQVHKFSSFHSFATEIFHGKQVKSLMYSIDVKGLPRLFKDVEAVVDVTMKTSYRCGWLVLAENSSEINICREYFNITASNQRYCVFGLNVADKTVQE